MSISSDDNNIKLYNFNNWELILNLTKVYNKGYHQPINKSHYFRIRNNNLGRDIIYFYILIKNTAFIFSLLFKRK